MDGINVPYLPTSLWVLAGAMTILILFVAFGFYFYWRTWANELSETGSDVATLKASKLTLEKDVESLREWIERQRTELDRMTAEREEQERLRAVLADLEQQCAVKNQDNQLLRNEVGELENQRHQMRQTLERLQCEVGDMESKRVESQIMESRLAQLKAEVEEAQSTVRDLAILEMKLSGLNSEKLTLESQIQNLRSTSELAHNEAQTMKQDAGQAKLELEQVVRELADVRRHRAELEVIIDTLRHEQNALEGASERLEKRIAELQTASRVAHDKAEKDALHAQALIAKAESAEKEVRSTIQTKQRLELELDGLNAQKAALSREILSLEGKTGSKPGENGNHLAPYADLLEKEPLCLMRGSFGRKRGEKDESKLLQQLKSSLREDGLIFHSRIIDAFHTSLKCHDISPITVLAGVSGTGKTLLPVRYAEAMGMHKLVMAVQPRWDSPQDMFGFYNYLEKEYKATELSRALVRMDPYNYPDDRFPLLKSEWTRDRLLLVLLDEMNLARTEYYFSEFLSRLELRRMVRHPELPSERSEGEIELDAGPGKERFRLWVGNNVFFVGTMNEDETTQTLSDKVLDRANILRFGRPDEKVASTRNGNSTAISSEEYLSFNQWMSWCRNAREDAEWYEPVSRWTSRLNSALNRVGRPFGFRVLQAVAHYVANYPRVEAGERYKLAFADQVEQKIIPKIRGIDLDNNNANECLSEIEAVISELNDSDLNEAFSSAREESHAAGMFQWRGVTRKDNEGLN